MADEASKTRRGEIGLGDLLTALDALADGDGRYAAAIGRCLGFAGIDPNPKERRSGAWDQTQQPEDRSPERNVQPGPGGGEPPPQTTVPEPPTEPRSTRWRPLEPIEWAPAPPDLSDVPRLSGEGEPPPFQSLLPTGTARSIISTAVATLAPGREPDIDRLIELLSTSRVPRAIPMLPCATLERGVDLLLDHSEGMEPLFDDLRTLVDQSRAVVGRERHWRYSFRGDPFAAGRRIPGQKEAERWRPTRGRPVLVATDVGLNAPPEARDTVTAATWRAFGQRCREARCPVILLIPRRPSLWPAFVFDYFAPVHWDPHTRAGTVRHLVAGRQSSLP